MPSNHFHLSPFHFPLERISHSKVEGKIAAESGMDNGITVFFLLIRRIDSLHTPVETQYKEIQVKSQS